MDKALQRHLTRWLRNAAKPARGWLMLTLGCGLAAGLAIIGQAWVLAELLHQLIIEEVAREQLTQPFLLLAALIAVKSLALAGRERFSFNIGALVRQNTRAAILDKMERLGSAYTGSRAQGAWTTMLLEQTEQIQEFFAKYLPQMMLAGMIPLLILVLLFPINWVAGLILLGTAPLTVLFMAIIGMGAADANKRNFQALGRLSGIFLDRLRGISTVRQFAAVDAQARSLHQASDEFRQRTMEVLRLAFLSSAVLEFFAAISIALVAVYFGFSYLGHLDFGHYGTGITLFTGFLVLLLAPEFYQPLRDLGAFYHAKAQALGAAESIVEFLEQPEPEAATQGVLTRREPIALRAEALVVTAADGTPLTRPVSFTLASGRKLGLVGPSGAGKSSILKALMGLLPYQGSLTVNGTEVRELARDHWMGHYSWLGQNPALVHGSVRDNLLLGHPEITGEQLTHACALAHLDEALALFPAGLDHRVGDRNSGLSVGQAQRLALARALLKDAPLLLLDEPTASLDHRSETLVMDGLRQHWRQKSVVLVSHRRQALEELDQVLEILPREADHE
ncbi:cysteine/glutathione ABC transporter permease/ATP-binding protein CydD [Ferrimonas sediminicola]|uniref:Cysteine/glutathione ABC transporter permease/ATP-binding protein CydD n=1 Tax=Ferrimonas sediminicola TaxID=2569538 RepID=A0A4U1BEX0_9GAMM|nr:cysteine/glutathione ABC transporter permease/ATP-binding protein CydD [Ferrimonas sediminicola]TKB48890.1 cysteine/glutathione ABC transporter permease/ATP-binding protein CydD [Ferrimonas sediminicola]